MADRFFYEITFKDGSTSRCVAESAEAAIKEMQAEVIPEYREGITAKRMFDRPVKTGTPQVK